MVIAAAGVDHISPHALRHTAATLMMKQGMGHKIAGEILGHASSRTLLDVYSHVSENMQTAAAERMARQLLFAPDTTTSDGSDVYSEDPHA